MVPPSQSLNLDAEAISGILGSISIACWVTVFTPQILENFRRASAESLSLEFIVIWSLGDLFNVFGGILQGVLPTMLILAVYYVLADVVLIWQCLYYRGVPSREDSPTPPSERQPQAEPNGHRPSGPSRRSSAVDATHLSPATPLAEPTKPSRRRSRPLQTALLNLLAVFMVAGAGVFGWWVSTGSQRGPQNHDHGHGPAPPHHTEPVISDGGGGDERNEPEQCDNARPKCQKCVASGRECGGYERQMIFIVGTTNERGRCSSHPHRSILTAKQKMEKEKERERERERELSRPQLDWQSHSEGERSSTLPPTPTPINGTPTPEISCSFLHSPSLSLNPSFEAEGEAFSLPGLTHSLPEFSDPDSTREFSLHAYSFVRETEAPYRSRPADGDVNPRARKKAHLEVDTYSTSRNGHAEPATTLLFVYNSTGAPSGEAGPFHCLHGGTSSEIKSRDPSSFQKFPAHQFFANLYRPFACFDAMSRRQATFLARPEWCAAPWEDIPKTPMDRLLDIQVMLPGIFERAKRTEAFPPSAYRRLKAKDLLDNCTRLDKSFEEWYSDLKSQSDGPLYWTIDAVHTFPPKPRNELNAIFPTSLEFTDLDTALLHLNYWAALCLFYQTIQQIQQNCMEVAPSPPARSSYTPPVPAHSAYSPPSTRAFAEVGGYMGSSPSYSTPSPHASVSPAADFLPDLSTKWRIPGSADVHNYFVTLINVSRSRAPEYGVYTTHTNSALPYKPIRPL
ncbi:hypothetical protein V501_10091 [Pseudogymnoascus sp. VKM F-4519 (FW-2642)]|nr:hypothetical protein V501_10091 [Pseudogymnoascus sp. VKM F-4519 (FW-2642)]